jgi:hypothetical protein
MSKKSIIGIIITVVAIGIVGSITAFLLSFRTVTFIFDKPDAHIAIYRADDKDKKGKLAEITKDAAATRLQEGEYQAVVTDEAYDDKPTNFTVKRSDSTVSIDIAFSRRRLEGLVDQELPTINVAIRAAFPSQIERFGIEKGKLYDEGQWYTTSLIETPLHQSEEGDVYHLVMKKEGDTWKAVGKPTLVLMQSEFKDVPLNILKEGNRQNSL